MQPFGYLAENGIVNFDANAYLNSPTPAGGNYLPFPTQLDPDIKMNGQATADGFTSSKATTIKKVAAGAILATLAVVGISKCKTGVGKLTNAVKAFFK